MKKIKQTILALSFIAAFLLPIAGSEAQAAPAFSAVAQTLNSPEDIAKYIWKNFRVESDQAQFGREDHWQTPDELLKNRKGDCEDFSRFAYEILKKNGISAFMINVYGKKYAHTVCVFKENGKYHILDGTDVKRTNAKSLNEVFEKIYPFWDTGAIVRANNNHQGQILKSIARKALANRQMAIAA